MIKEMLSYLDRRPDAVAKLRKMDREGLRVWVARQSWAKDDDEALL